MADFKVLVLFDGVDYVGTKRMQSNVAKIKEGLVRDHNQFVVYLSDFDTFTSLNSVAKSVIKFLGLQDEWMLKSAEKMVINELQKHRHLLKERDRVQISVVGFAKGATLARYFARNNVKTLYAKIKAALGKMQLSVTLETEFLFETVSKFVYPLYITILAKCGLIKVPNDYKAISIPHDAGAVHAVSLDEIRSELEPLLIDLERNHEEVWFDGDISDIGGGQECPFVDSSLAEDNPLRYMVLRAIEKGIKFDAGFLAKHSIYRDGIRSELGIIHTPARTELPATKRKIRKVYVQKDGKESVDDGRVKIFETVARRMESDDSYRPRALDNVSDFDIVTFEGLTLQYDQRRLATELHQRALSRNIEMPAQTRRQFKVERVNRIK